MENTGKQHGEKVIALYKYAISNGADYIFQTDADGQTEPNEFETFWVQRTQYSGIFGHRNNRKDGAIRKFVEKVVCILLRLYFRVNIPDANAPFRLMSAEILDKYIHQIHPTYNLPNIIITTYFIRGHEKYKFIPITFKPRQGGINSINFKKIINIGWKALWDFKEFRKKMP